MKKLLEFWEFTFLTIKSLKKKNFDIHAAKIEIVLKVRRMRDLTIEGKTNIRVTCCFKSFTSGFEKDSVQFYCRTVEYYRKELYLARKKTKIKHPT